MLAQCENSESTIRMKENNWYEWYSKNQMKFRKIKHMWLPWNASIAHKLQFIYTRLISV